MRVSVRRPKSPAPLDDRLPGRWWTATQRLPCRARFPGFQRGLHRPKSGSQRLCRLEDPEFRQQRGQAQGWHCLRISSGDYYSLESRQQGKPLKKQEKWSLAGEEGFEPSNAGIKIRCLNRLGDSPRAFFSRFSTGASAKTV